MEFINNACDTTIKVIGTLAIVMIADKAGLFNPIKRKWKKLKDKMEEQEQKPI